MPGVRKADHPLRTPRHHVALADPPSALAWSGNGDALAIVMTGGTLAVVSAHSGKILHNVEAHAQGALSVGWRPNSDTLVTGGQDGFLRWWDARTGKAVREQSLGRSWVERVVWHPEGDRCAAAAGKAILWWQESSGRSWKTIDHPATVADLAWSPDGAQLAAASYGGIWLWSPGAVEGTQTLAWKGSALVLSWSPDGRYLAAGEQDSSVHIWKVGERKESRMWGFAGKVRELAWDPTARYLGTGGGPDVCVWDCSEPGPEGREPMLCQITDVKLTALSWNRAHALLAAGYADGMLRLWQPPQHPFPIAEVGGAGQVSHLQWSPDGSQLAVARQSGLLDIY